MKLQTRMTQLLTKACFYYVDSEWVRFFLLWCGLTLVEFDRKEKMLKQMWAGEIWYMRLNWESKALMFNWTLGLIPLVRPGGYFSELKKDLKYRHDVSVRPHSRALLAIWRSTTTATETLRPTSARKCDGSRPTCQWARKPCQTHRMTDCPENTINCTIQGRTRGHLHTNSVPIWIKDGWAR